MTILDSLFPRSADNAYRGHKLGLWILGVVALLNGIIGFNSALNTRSVAMQADGIPLDAFPAAASQIVLLLFALLGVTRIVMFALSLVVLFRYRALTPLILSLFLLGELLSRGIHKLHPTPMTQAPGAIVIMAIAGVTLLGLVLSLWERKRLDVSP